VPEYPGTLEIEASDGVYYIINDVNLEEYLKLVVPSEMPVSY
jgi:stage II sporulation protein D